MLNFVLSQLSRTQIAQNLMGSITTTKKHVAQTLACLFAEANYSSLCALANQNIWAFIELIQRGVFEEVEMGVRKIGFRVCNCFGKWRRMYFRRPGHFKSHNQRRFVRLWIKPRPRLSSSALESPVRRFLWIVFRLQLLVNFDKFTLIFVFV